MHFKSILSNDPKGFTHGLKGPLACKARQISEVSTDSRRASGLSRRKAVPRGYHPRPASLFFHAKIEMPPQQLSQPPPALNPSRKIEVNAHQRLVGADQRLAGLL
jgi:hypothetical protein